MSEVPEQPLPRITIMQGQDYNLVNGTQLAVWWGKGKNDVKAYVCIRRPNGSRVPIPVVPCLDGVFSFDFPAQDMTGNYRFKMVIVSDAEGIIEEFETPMRVIESVR